jgi:hypothetical protein
MFILDALSLAVRIAVQVVVRLHVEMPAISERIFCSTSEFLQVETQGSFAI